MKLELHTQLTDAFEAYGVAKSLKAVAARAKESALENLRITRDRHEYGQSDTLNLLRAQLDLTTAENAYNNAYYDLYLSVATIRRISGL
jgi:outer membrane protein TolC